MDKGTEVELADIHRQLKKLNLQKLRLIKANADPEKSKRLFEVSQMLYLQILDTDVAEDLNLKLFIESVVASLSEEDTAFFNEHKHGQFHQGKKLFNQYSNHNVQKLLQKERYLNISGINKQKTLNQLIKFVAGAKVQHYRDSLIKELKALREKESIRYTLFEEDGYNQITDYNERECLLTLKTNPELKDTVIMDKLKVPKSNWYRYKDKFRRLGLI
jgi:hypothetical protein